MTKATPAVANKPKKKAPRKPRKQHPATHIPTDQTRRQVSAMSGYGLTHKAIGTVIGISDVTLRKRYAPELAHGDALAQATIGKSLYDFAVGRPAEYDENKNKIRDELPADRSVAIFASKVRLGFRETTRTELTGANGGPIQTTSLDLSRLNDAEARQLRLLLAKATPDGPADK